MKKAITREQAFRAFQYANYVEFLFFLPDDMQCEYSRKLLRKEHGWQDYAYRLVDMKMSLQKFAQVMEEGVKKFYTKKGRGRPAHREDTPKRHEHDGSDFDEVYG